VQHVHKIRLSDLRGIDKQIERVEQNARQFLDGKPANNVLLTGARGTGKSSIVKGLLNKYSGQGLRLIEVEKNDLVDLPYIVDLVAPRKERFLLFCDDLTFHGAEDGYIALKVALDGSISTTSENLLIYATSNRRHLMPEYMGENLEYKPLGEEIHPGETSEERSRFRALRPVGHLLSVRPGRVPGDRRALAEDPRLRLGRRARGGAAVGAAARLAQRACRLSVRARLRGSPHGRLRGWSSFKKEVM
jgi:hypothetical protein